MDFRFPEKERLKSKKQIEQLFKKGNSISSFPLKLIYSNATEDNGVKVKTAFSVPKKNFKSAVKRNRIKRLMRESYRLNRSQIFNNMEGNFAFLFLYLGKELPEYSTVERSMLNVFNKLIKEESDAKITE